MYQIEVYIKNKNKTTLIAFVSVPLLLAISSSKILNEQRDIFTWHSNRFYVLGLSLVFVMSTSKKLHLGFS